MNNYYIYKDEVLVGPYSLEELRKMLAGKMITGETVAQISGGPRDGTYLPVSELIGSSVDPVTLTTTNVAPLLSMDGDVMRIACPVCGQHYKIPCEEYSSDKYRCLKCESVFRLPPRPAAAGKEPEKSAEKEFYFDSEIPEGDLLCPHCWKSFDQDYVLYISVHPSLFGDPVLGEYVQKRFVPTVFNQSGQPLDQCGLPATEMACPRCHLRIPASLLDTPALYFSIAGATSSGKSYYLTCLTHQLRKVLPEYFGAAFFDVDPRLNETLNTYEKQLFMSLTPEKLTALPATQISGDGISDRVRLDDIEIELPKPFVFEFRSKDSIDDINMIFYDNSGEMFIPGRDEWVNQATFHLSHSHGIVFLFDPTSDAAMRLKLCDIRDPQVSKNPRVVDQTILLNEMINRIRRHANMVSSEGCSIPLTIAVGKYDTWQDKFSKEVSSISYVTTGEDGENILNMDNILDVSFALRELMLKYAPGLVNAAESFFEKVCFVPVSNFGTIAEQNENGVIGIVPEKITSVWVEVPLLLMLSNNDQLPAGHAGEQGEPLGTVFKNSIVFEHPESGRRTKLPRNYSGALLKIGGKSYRLPEIDTEQ
ncbi:MAG: hypothetical protein IKC65_02010 [Lentisphaeria bacterium]|nr:hypothetical protein [Lentisphaeria bacterium]